MVKKNLTLVLSLTLIGLAISVDDGNDDWLHVNDQAQIVDSAGKVVWLTGTNWFGYNTGTGCFDGSWARNVKEMLQEIADHGFNFLRVPISTQILLQWKNGDPDPKKPGYDASRNPELAGLSSFETFIQVGKWCKEMGIKIMIDIHSAETHASGHLFNLWYNEKFSTQDWIDALTWFAGYFKDDDTFLAIDLKNEPHGKPEEIQEGKGAKWDDSTDPFNWKYAAECAGRAVLEKNPNLLIMVEGGEVFPKDGKDWTQMGKNWATGEEFYYGGWWGGNLRGVKDYPVDLGKYQKQLVYSPHDYGPLLYPQAWFHEGFTKDSLMEEYWHDQWLYVYEEKIAPILIGEWGAKLDDGDNERWFVFLRDLIQEYHIHHTFWCFNENSGDTGGLVEGNFGTWDEAKYKILKPVLWQKGGKFVGLDHKIPLGANGISLSDA